MVKTPTKAMSPEAIRDLKESIPSENRPNSGQKVTTGTFNEMTRRMNQDPAETGAPRFKPGNWSLMH
eukprot:gene17837-794_t